ncbi:SDR family oxidoreductase [Sphingomonas sp. RP10(2022)]|uniref:SDR family oxidoreductase n=1 Tax=Sphingomonas liriopis TaxID=2949094 RepID=A0A9X2HPI2_9SPHN|nr:SDR family oxidoreductase [Sphingomonas liriopis]MCP3734012.1 SDR family oxidoreductase [Sphingomonas liriopis]
MRSTSRFLASAPTSSVRAPGKADRHADGDCVRTTDIRAAVRGQVPDVCPPFVTDRIRDRHHPELTMPRKIRPKTILITGGASGIGAETARLAARKGHRIAVSDVDLAGAKAIADELGGGSFALPLDITNAAQWEKALDTVWKTFDGLDVLINNAGVVHPGNARSVDNAGHQRTIDINFMGPLKGMLAVFPRMLAQGHGQLVTVCSMSAFLPSPGLASYSASKHALRAFHHAMGMEERKGPIKFTIVHPTATETPMLEQEAQNDDTALAFAASPVTPQYVAEVIVDAMEKAKLEVFMPQDRARWIRNIGTNAQMLRKLADPGIEAGVAALNARRAAKG